MTAMPCAITSSIKSSIKIPQLKKTGKCRKSITQSLSALLEKYATLGNLTLLDSK